VASRRAIGHGGIENSDCLKENVDWPESDRIVKAIAKRTNEAEGFSNLNNALLAPSACWLVE
jgi:hypothetical protein